MTGPQAELKRNNYDADRDRPAGRGELSAQVPGYQHSCWAEDRAIDELEVVGT
jgi:hypothetical protein